MPINKDALKRYQIIDRILSDPYNDFTTAEIQKEVNRSCEPVTLRMIQKDINHLEEYFGKEIVRNDGLDNFTWLDLLKKKLDVPSEKARQPYICFSKNEGLQMPRTLLGRLFTAIARKKTLRLC